MELAKDRNETATRVPSAASDTRMATDLNVSGCGYEKCDFLDSRQLEIDWHGAYDRRTHFTASRLTHDRTCTRVV